MIMSMIMSMNPAPAQFGAPARVSAGKYVTINYTLRTNGAIRHIRSAVWGDEPLAYHRAAGSCCGP